MTAGSFSCLPLDLAVVPIFVNTGAALLPAVAAAVATFFALLLKPKTLLRACRAKPALTAGVLLVVAAAGLTVWLWPRPGEGEAPTGRRGRRARSVGATAGDPAGIDWTTVALARIRARERGELKPAPPEQSAALPPATDGPLIYRGGPRRTGALGPPPRPPIRLAWETFPSWVDVDGTTVVDRDAMILSSPIVYGDRVYAASCVLDPPDSYGAIFCVDAETGKTHWSVDLINGEEIKGFFSSPALTADGRYLVIGQGLHPDTNCRLICIDTATGRVHWTVHTPLHLESSPAIEDGVVYVGAGAIEDPETRKPLSHTGYVMAVRISDGSELWRYDVADPESSPVVQDGVVYIGSGFNGNAVVALRTGSAEDLARDGLERLLWRTPAPYPVTGAVTLAEGMVIAGGGNGDFVYRDPNPAGAVLALDARTGEVRWRAAMPDAVLGAIAAGEQGEQLVCPVASGEVVALDVRTGRRLWAASINGNAPVLAGVALAGEAVFAVSHDGFMVRLGRRDGALIEKVYINASDRPGERGMCVSSPFVAAGRLFVGSETGGLRCYMGAPAE